MFTKLFGTAKEKQNLNRLFTADDQAGSIVILSGVCCNPLSFNLEDRLKTVLGDALSDLGIHAEIRHLSITDAQNHLATLTASHRALVQDIQAIFQSHGLKAFPALVLNGHLACYGGVPAPDFLREALRTHLQPAG